MLKINKKYLKLTLTINIYISVAYENKKFIPHWDGGAYNEVLFSYRQRAGRVLKQ